MVVHLYANVTVTAVKSPGWTHYLARFAKTQLLRKNAVFVFILAVLLHVLEFTNAKESLAGSKFLVGWISGDFFHGFVFNVVGPAVVDPTARDPRNNAWLRVSCEDEETHGVNNERQFNQPDNYGSIPAGKGVISK